MFGPVSSQGVINTVNANIGFPESTTPNRIYTVTGDTTTANVSSENWEDNF
jgi:hypothetical protein